MNQKIRIILPLLFVAFLQACGHAKKSEAAPEENDFANFEAPLIENAPPQEDLSSFPKNVAPSGIDSVRVQIFPHLGSYSTPQGREKVVDRVAFQSEGTCILDHNAPKKRIDIRLADLGNRTLTLRCDQPATLVRESGLHAFSYSGYFQIRALRPAQGTPRIQVINILPFEDYLKGVVPAEMPVHWPAESLKAQAVAARTYATFEILVARENSPDRIWDVDDTVQYQAYRGITPGTQASDEAVQATAGQILVYQGHVIKAYFSADSGGYTESAQNAFREKLDYCVAKPEAYELNAIQSHWRVATKLSNISQAMKQAGVIPGAAQLVGVKVDRLDRFESGRVSKVNLLLKDGSERTIIGTRFAYYMKLRSNFIRFDGEARLHSQAKGVVIDGWGFGHGVGMNQTGAKVLNEKLGWDYRKILAFYYTDAELGVPSSAAFDSPILE